MKKDHTITGLIRCQLTNDNKSWQFLSLLSISNINKQIAFLWQIFIWSHIFHWFHLWILLTRLLSSPMIDPFLFNDIIIYGVMFNKASAYWCSQAWIDDSKSVNHFWPLLLDNFFSWLKFPSHSHRYRSAANSCIMGLFFITVMPIEW